ncbi:MAG: 50S ribosomal protein L17 [Parcubacteria group bacterium GW2011_GWA1_36_12]|nr:MAG: 50S ribosomal protein L17 [Parcubacteria group bacterium GW2011_GWA1_36_12]
MRKRNKGRKLSRKIGPRKQLLKTLANSFFLHGKIKTTEAKAKELRPIVEKMITRAKDNNITSRRLLSQALTPKMVKKIVEEIALNYKDRNGGYTRITKLGPRNSDGAKMAIIELVK